MNRAEYIANKTYFTVYNSAVPWVTIQIQDIRICIITKKSTIFDPQIFIISTIVIRIVKMILNSEFKLKILGATI